MGGDSVDTGVDVPVPSFNPHPRMGGDIGFNKNIKSLGVSIHTPVWGVTPENVHDATIALFQSTPPYGG